MRRLTVILAFLALTAACSAQQLPPQASAATKAIDTADRIAQVLLYVTDGATVLNTARVLSDQDTARVMHAMVDASAALKAVPFGAKAIAAALVQSLDGPDGLSPEGRKVLGPYLRFARLFLESIQ